MAAAGRAGGGHTGGVSPLWRCPRCGRRFARTDQAHACGHWTVAQHLEGKPAAVVDLYRRFEALVAACGPFSHDPVPRQIGFQGERRIFAGVSLTERSLDGYLDLPRAVDDPRIRRSSPYTKRLFVNFFRITDPAQLDPAFAAYVAEAYAVGRGARGAGGQGAATSGPKRSRRAAAPRRRRTASRASGGRRRLSPAARLCRRTHSTRGWRRAS